VAYGPDEWQFFLKNSPFSYSFNAFHKKKKTHKVFGLIFNKTVMKEKTKRTHNIIYLKYFSMLIHFVYIFFS
jgi:hypothetical protein